MRKVIWSEYVKKQKIEPYAGQKGGPGKVYHELEEQGEALFHQWGRDTHSDEDGSFSTAIIELEDGTVKNIPAEQVRFISGEISDKVTIEGDVKPDFDIIKELKKQAVKGE